MRRQPPYLALVAHTFIVAVCRGHPTDTDTSVIPLYASALRKVFFSLLSADLDLLLLTAAAQFVRLEGILRLELGAAMLGNVTFSHPDDKIVSVWWASLRVLSLCKERFRVRWRESNAARPKVAGGGFRSASSQSQDSLLSVSMGVLVLAAV